MWAKHGGLDAVYYDQNTVGTLLKATGRYRTVINSEQRFGLAAVASDWAVRRRGQLVGFDTNRGRASFTSRVGYDWKDAHELLEFARLISAAEGVPVPSDLLAVPRRLASNGRSVVALGGTHSESRNLSAEAWLGWVRSVAGDEPLDLVFGPAEERLGLSLLQLAAGQLTPRPGSFRDVVQTIGEAERLITIDGGLVHVATYYGVPADVLFTAGRDKKWAPLGAGSRMHFRADLPCRPCTVFGQVPMCPIAFECSKHLDTRLSVFDVDVVG
ncbi:glycosyltransferase family 9 protein [Herbiconiux sp. L3-i23]|uniref:glycosyltransferase family 9 protein n=1 Tax=Herbiconiux sp. L3-i23 TaxID=2905871 RepID=UPI002074763E|nr:hypothetical protein [Herbiconiux sp. L3-i23]